MVLFKGVKNDETNADIGWRKENNAIAYEEGYLTAAQKLSEGFSDLYVKDKDTLIFPIIFLYRQYLELSLKSIMKELSVELKHDLSKSIHKHSLLNIWDNVEKLYSKYISLHTNNRLIFTKQADLAQSRKIIIEFDKVDSGSFTFRYATDKKDKNILNGINYISLGHFEKSIGLLLDVIKSIRETIAHA